MDLLGFPVRLLSLCIIGRMWDGLRGSYDMLIAEEIMGLLGWVIESSSLKL